MNLRYFTDIRNDILYNNDLSLGAKELYCRLICFNLASSLKTFIKT